MLSQIPLSAALLCPSWATLVEDASMLQMPVASHGIQSDTDEDDSECRCPGYYQSDCNANWWQGCSWADGATHCACDDDYVYTSKVFTGRYIRPSGANADSPIYWEKMGVKYTISSCGMCNDDTDLADTDKPCYVDAAGVGSWVEVDDTTYIQRLTTDDSPFQCAQHPNHGSYVATASATIADQACHAMDHKMIQGCLSSPRNLATGCNVADVRCCADDGSVGATINSQTRTHGGNQVACNSGGFASTFTFGSSTLTGLSCTAGHCNNIADSYCYEAVTFEQAQGICASQSQRLCTRAEIEDGVCCGNGCSHNGHLIWFDDDNGPASNTHCSSNPTTLTEITADDIQDYDQRRPVTTQTHNAVPFASSSLAGSCTNDGEGEGADFGGAGTACFGNINDGVKGSVIKDDDGNIVLDADGNAQSDKAWIPGGRHNGKRFVGVRFDGVQSINTFTLARDRYVPAPDDNYAALTDKIGSGNFEFEYTMTQSAGYDTPNSEWCSAGVFTRADAGVKIFRLSPHVQATAIRIVVPDANSAIDELEAWYQFDGNNPEAETDNWH